MVETKSEFKDFSLSSDVLIKELNESEIKSILSDKNTNEQFKKKFLDDFQESKIYTKDLTENNALTHYTTGDPTLDFLFLILEDTGLIELNKLIDQSWNFNSLSTLKLVGNLRDIQDGKGIRTQYYFCLHYIYINHPKTLLRNLEVLIGLGYWKDILNLNEIILIDNSDYFLEEKKSNIVKTFKKTKKLLKSQNKIDFKVKKMYHKSRKNFYSVLNNLNQAIFKMYEKDIKDQYEKKNKPFIGITSNHIDKKMMSELIIKNARKKFETDKKYRYFHLKFAELFAKQLISDLEELNKNGLKAKLSLAAKWAPSLNGHYDKYSLISTSIALQIAKLTRNTDINVEEIFTKPIPIAVYLARKNYHKNYLTKLRKHLKLPEIYMTSNQWNILPYEHVASKCLQRNFQLFIEHDKERFEEFIFSKKVSGKTLNPIELVQRGFDLISKNNVENKIEIEVLEKQWQSLVDDVFKNNKNDKVFKSAVCICDTSNSMAGNPLFAAIGLTLFTMMIANKPWCDMCITFSCEPIICKIEKHLPFLEKIKIIKRMSFSLNTNINKVFELILDIAEEYSIKKENMPNSLFIFTDMEFDEGCDSENKTNFEEAKDMFKSKDYSLPKVIFWNLRSSKSIPVRIKEENVILVSGYSSKILKLLIQIRSENIINPIEILNKIIDIPTYKKLVVD